MARLWLSVRQLGLCTAMLSVTACLLVIVHTINVSCNSCIWGHHTTDYGSVTHGFYGPVNYSRYNLSDGNYPMVMISLKGSLRRAFATPMVNESSFHMEFFDGIDGRNVTFKDINDTYKLAVINDGYVEVPYDLELASKSPGRHFLLDVGEIGVALSHFMVYRKCYLEDLPAVLIMEDDVWFRFNDSKVRDILRHLPDPQLYDVAYVQLHHPKLTLNLGKPFPGTNGYFHYGGKQFGAYGYVVTQRLCQHAYFRYVMFQPADDWLHFSKFTTICAADEYLFVDGGAHIFKSERMSVGLTRLFATTGTQP